MAQETKSLDALSELKGAVAPPDAAPQHVQKLDQHGRAYATGKRKNAVARVWLKPGKGMITVNDKDPLAFLGRRVLELAVIKLGRYWSPWPNASGYRSA